MADASDDRLRGPEPLGEILSRVLTQSGLLDQKQQIEFAAAWREVAGHRVADHTRIQSYRGRVLTIAVDSAPLRQELEVFQKEELTRALRVRLPGRFVERIRFLLV